jgi:hypothetical protein
VCDCDKCLKSIYKKSQNNDGYKAVKNQLYTSSDLCGFFQQLLDVTVDEQWSHLGSVPLKDTPLAVDKELLKVPLDVSLFYWRPLHGGWYTKQIRHLSTRSLGVSEEGVFVGAVDVELLGELEVRHEASSRSHVVQPVHDLPVTSWLLEVKVVTGSSDHHEVSGVVYSVD